MHKVACRARWFLPLCEQKLISQHARNTEKVSAVFSRCPGLSSANMRRYALTVGVGRKAFGEVGIEVRCALNG